jgi:hypothetical protein
VFKRAKDFYQRGKRGWADRDCWSLDCYLAGVMADSIEHLKNTNHGCPQITPNYEHGEGHEKLWIAIQDVMIDGLKAHIAITNMDWLEFDLDSGFDMKAYFRWEADKRKQFDAAWVLLGHYWGALWD